jgi:MoxR-like ATPase
LAQLAGGEESRSVRLSLRYCERSEAIHAAAQGKDGLLRRFAPRNDGQEVANDSNQAENAHAMKDREEIAQALAASGYIADGELATAISLMQLLKRPLLLEGEAGVGKTEVAKALASVHATELIRLQCYEGLDQSSALYEWNYQRQLLAIQAHRGEDADAVEDRIFSEKYLLERPLLAAIRRDKPPVLLIDEIDRADDEFEAFLLELLSDFQVSIPELGTITATTIPHVVLTSNGTRELSDALRRRCLYHYVDYPDVDREARIIMTRIDGTSASLSLQIARMVEGIRKEELRKVPGVAETLDWAAALVGLDVRDLLEVPETVHETLMCLLKTQEDRARMTREVTERILGKVA